MVWADYITILESISIHTIDNLGMEQRLRRLSLPEAFFEGTQLLHDKGEGCG